MLTDHALRRLIEHELETDRVSDDVTCHLLSDNGRVRCEAVVFAKQKGVFSGRAVVEAFPGPVAMECLLEDGASLEVGTRVALLRGTAVECLTAERTLLNLLSHLSGVATLTREYVEAASATKILATRKTLPGLRDLQLQAVRSGGGHVHRRSLSDGILVKDNHLMFVAEGEVVARAHAMRSPLHRVEVEVQSLEQLDRLLVNPPDVVMLDNFTLDQMRVAVERIAGRCEIEVSGGVSLDRVSQIAALGVQYISVGRLTHSVPALDLSLDIAVAK
jgi:nicotinate-nucleotide pyrophosphorylase (carboxylating)